MSVLGSDPEVPVSELLFELPIQEMLYELIRKRGLRDLDPPRAFLGSEVTFSSLLGNFDQLRRF